MRKSMKRSLKAGAANKIWQGSILSLIGNTPLVEIRKLNPNPKVRILAKLEGENPGGSVKARIAKFMIEGAEKEGKLKPGNVILEATSGNTGIALAMVGAVKGYKVVLVMPEDMSIERRKMMLAYGARFVLSNAGEGTDGARKVVEGMLEEDRNYFFVNQFANEYNVRAHYETTGPEIWRDTKGRVDVFVAGIGTGGTITGAGGFLKEMAKKKRKLRIVGVEPEGRFPIQGLRSLAGGDPKIFDRSVVDDVVRITAKEAFDTARELARKEGLFVGVSSGAAARAAFMQAEKMKRGTIVVMFPDGGEKYLSTKLF